eukprot:924230-Prorocentrum_minimum.AAC.17
MVGVVVPVVPPGGTPLQGGARVHVGGDAVMAYRRHVAPSGRRDPINSECVHMDSSRWGSISMGKIHNVNTAKQHPRKCGARVRRARNGAELRTAATPGWWGVWSCAAGLARTVSARHLASSVVSPCRLNASGRGAAVRPAPE